MDQEALANLRRERLNAWKEKYKVSQMELAKRMNVGRAYVSLLLKKNTIESRGRHFGEKAARAVELSLGLPNGYLDKTDSGDFEVVEWDDVNKLPEDAYALVPRVSVVASAGGGSVVAEEVDLPPLAFRKGWLARKGVTNRGNLRVLDVKGDSMEPFLMSGDTVLVDTGQTEIRDGEIYCIQYGEELRVKRLSRRFDGGMFIRSDNHKYPEESLNQNDLAMISVKGKVIWRCG